jgi:glycosyltransferase involved in cell wall biosynthesis
VIPVRNGGRDFERCLRGLRASTWADYELLVIDDGSTDGSAALAASLGARVLAHDRPLGPAAARNAGARAASGHIVFFLDADVVPHPDTIARIMARFAADPGLAALFGSYDDQPAAPGLVSQYRNLLHHYVHQQGEFVADARPAHTFWTGCGAIRREVFLAVGGFDPRLYRRPAIEDIELGYRLTRAGHRIVLARDVLATHLKRWTLRSILRTDILQRGVPWMLLMMRSQVAENDLNVSRAQRLCVAATGLGLVALALALALLQPSLALLFALNLAVQAAANLRFYRFLAARKGPAFALGAFPLHYVYYLCCGVSVALAIAIKQAFTRKADIDATDVRADAAEFPRPRSTAAGAKRRPSPWTTR